MARKKVYFYKLELQRILENANENGSRFEYLDEDFVNNIIRDLVEENIIVLEEADNDGEGMITFEMRNSNENFIYGIIGKTKNTGYHKRNIQTRQSSELELPVGEKLEIFTYVVISLNDGVLVYVGGQYSPGVRNLESLGRLYSNIQTNKVINNRIKVNINQIIRRDVLESIIRDGRRINKIDCSIAIPGRDLLSEIIRIGDPNDANPEQNQNMYEQIHGIKEQKLQFTLTAEEFFTFRECGILGALVDNMKRIFGVKKEPVIDADGNTSKREDGISKLNLSVESDESRLIELSLLDDKYCQYDEFNMNTLTENEIFDKLLGIYEMNRGNLRNYIRVTKQ